MKSYEELRSMTQEDLVRLVLELQEEIETLNMDYERTLSKIDCRTR